MILFTVGTNEQPFDRLVSAAADLSTETGYVQYGSSRVPRGRGTWVDFVPFQELRDLMLAAQVVICHAGVGSIMLAHRAGRRPIVVPRLLRLSEAVDNHQLPLARRLHERGIVTLVEDTGRLDLAIGSAKTPARWLPEARPLPGADALAAELCGHLTALGVSRDERAAPVVADERAAPVVAQSTTLY